MELTHTFTVTAPIDTVWDAFMDLQGVAECFPGATVTHVDDEGFQGTVKVKLGPIALLYKGSGSFVERDDQAHKAVIEAKGKDKRGNGTAGATATVTMQSEGESTRAEVTTDLNVTGKPAQFGRGVMQDVSDKLLGQFVDCLEKRLGGSGADEGSAGAADQTTGATSEAAVPAAAAASPAPSQAPPARESASTQDSSGSTAGDALDLGSAVLPTVLRSYAPYAVAGVVGLVLGILLGRRGG